MNIFKKSIRLLVLSIVTCLFCVGVSFAAEQSFSPSVHAYVIEDGDGFDINKGSQVTKLPFGEKTIGKFSVSGPIEKETVYEERDAYGVLGEVTFTYTYDGSYNGKEQKEWKIADYLSPSDVLSAKFSLSTPIRHGAIFIQKSVDGKEWEEASDPVKDAFSKENSASSKIYTTLTDDTKNGHFYRVTVLYQLTRKEEKNEYKNCVEIYEFYVASEENYLIVRDIYDKKTEQPKTVVHGFCIDKNGSESEIRVTEDTRTLGVAQNYDSFTTPGEYTIETTTKLLKKYQYKINVTEGLTSVSLKPDVYESKNNTGFGFGNKVDKTVFNSNSYTVLKVAQTFGKSIEVGTKGTMPSYGISGKNAFVLLKLKYGLTLTGGGQEVVYDKWGKGKKDLIEGENVGQIGTGALIVQTSGDGESWENEDLGRYAEGLYTTDFGANYNANEDTVIYAPSGDDVKKGLYVRVLYAYQVYDYSTKKYKDYIEEYKFYLCSSELNAVTFHNLSLTNSVSGKFGETKDEVAIASKAETLQSGDMTVTGFRIDKSLNPTVSYTVKRNGNIYIVPNSGEVKDDGRFEITLKSDVGTEKTVILYVDTESSEDSLKRYFGDAFITGKRIFSEGEYPVYEAGLTSYNIIKRDEKVLPVSGSITNKTTGKTIRIDASDEEKTAVLDEPGEYIAEFVTESGTSSGDRKKFTFRFSLIAQGTAPGPVVNQEKLLEYGSTNISDSYPMYYGVTYQSASKGNITLAFANREDAADYARTYEKGMVEVQEDGSYHYNGDLFVTQKKEYESNWDLTDAINFFAEKAVRESFFDLSEISSYRTLKEDVIKKTKNLRTLELNNSVVIFADGQREILEGVNTLPTINSKKYAYQDPGINVEEEKGQNCFKFVKDEKGYDSKEVFITDCEGKKINIKYKQDVGEQLENAGCASGVVTITETTCYGDQAVYQAIFIREQDNTAEVNVSYYSGGKEYTGKVTSRSREVPESVDAFSIAAVSDPLDQYSLIKVSDGKESNTYVSDRVMKDAWSSPGTYHIEVINRLGTAYSFDINVVDSDYTVVSFAGEGSEKTKDIVTSFNEENVKLPALERYGFEFDGYTDQNGEKYTDVIPVIKSKSTIVLTPNWIPKKSRLVIKDATGAVLLIKDVDFGSKIKPADELDTEKYKVASWMVGDTPIASDKVTVDTENEIIITAVMKTDDIPVQGTEAVVEDASKEPDEKETSPVGWILAALGALAASAFVVLKKKGFIG